MAVAARLIAQLSYIDLKDLNSGRTKGPQVTFGERLIKSLLSASSFQQLDLAAGLCQLASLA
jgi:hypothetical protein